MGKHDTMIWYKGKGTPRVETGIWYEGLVGSLADDLIIILPGGGVISIQARSFSKDNPMEMTLSEAIAYMKMLGN